MFIAMDEPEHGAQRKTVAPAFTPGNITELAVPLRAHTAEVIDSLPIGARFDWVEKVSVELATRMLATVLGFPQEDRHLLTFWSDWAGNMEAARIPDLFQVRREVLTEMATYFQMLWQQRLANPGSKDLLGMMMQSESMSQMGPMEFIGNLALLIVGGADTAVLALNKEAAAGLRGPSRVSVVPGATHLFEEPGALEEAALLARDWFRQHLEPGRVD
jgi:cytochrome P450